MAASVSFPKIIIHFGALEIYVYMTQLGTYYSGHHMTEQEMVAYFTKGVKTFDADAAFAMFPYSQSSSLISALKLNTMMTNLEIIILSPGPKEIPVIVAATEALKNKLNLKQVAIRISSSHGIFSSINSMLSTLPLEDLSLVNNGTDLDGLDQLYEIKSLKRLTLDLNYEPTQARIGLADFMMNHVQILRIHFAPNLMEFETLAANLSNNTNLNSLSLDVTGLDLTALGHALKFNATLLALELRSTDCDLAPVLEGLDQNKSLVKLSIFDLSTEPFPDTTVEALNRMLQGNKQLESLGLYLDFIPQNMSSFVQPLGQSSLVELDINISESQDISPFVQALLRELESNTTMVTLEITPGPYYEDSTLDSSVLVDLLSNNQTLEALKIHTINFEHQERLQALIGNTTLTSVSSNMSVFLSKIAERNAFNKRLREASLLNLLF